MGWTCTLKDTARAGLRIERTRLEPLVTPRATAGLSLSGCAALWLFGGTGAAGAAYGALLGGIAVFQRSWRPDPVLPVISALTLGVTSFLSYLTGGHLPSSSSWQPCGRSWEAWPGRWAPSRAASARPTPR